MSKVSTKLVGKIGAQCRQPIGKISHHLNIIILALVLSIGCKESKQVGDSERQSLSDRKVHVAYAGGGWRAHTAHSAWTISLLNDGQRKLKEAFANVAAISSNSGGSWFSTMLMYSPDFVSDIERNHAAQTWATTTGWIAKQKEHFDAAPCSDEPEGLYLECVFDAYTGKSLSGGTYWKLVVDQLVFKDYPLGSKTLNAKRQPWAIQKPLLLASSLLTNTVVLNSENDLGNNHNYYQACLAPSKAILSGDAGSDCSLGRPVDVTPATFSSIPGNMDYVESPFFAELGTNSKSTFNLGYSADYVLEKAPKYLTSVGLPLDQAGVPIMTAAAASSAALGFGASEHITGLFDLSYTFEDDAISFGLADAKVKYINAQDIELAELAKHKMVRLADGGAVDNSAVAQLVRSLQLNGLADDFNIVAFDNVSTITDPGSGAAKVGIDIASLFGFADPLCVNLKLTEYCINTPSLQIFDSLALYNSDAAWTFSSGENQLVYTKYAVSTIGNDILGITKGSRGTLHSFTCSYPSAETAPVDGDKNFTAYTAMFQFINSGLSLDNGAGLRYLETALGILY